MFCIIYVQILPYAHPPPSPNLLNVGKLAGIALFLDGMLLAAVCRRGRLAAWTTSTALPGLAASTALSPDVWMFSCRLLFPFPSRPFFRFLDAKLVASSSFMRSRSRRTSLMVSYHSYSLWRRFFSKSYSCISRGVPENGRMAVCRRSLPLGSAVLDRVRPDDRAMAKPRCPNGFLFSSLYLAVGCWSNVYWLCMFSAHIYQRRYIVLYNPMFNSCTTYQVT